MDAAAEQFLRQLLETPSPSGYEQQIQEVVRQYVASFADKVTTDVHGNVVAVKNPNAARRIMFAGHCDQIGLLVQYIDSEGYIYVQSVGGWDIQQLIGQRMVIWSASGPIRGVIARKAIHLLTDEERKQVPKLKDLWIDIGARDKVEVESLVRVGDPVTLELGYQPMRNNMANSPGMDDKCGLWVVMEALRRAAAAGVKVGVYAVSTVQEEVGLRGAITSTYNIKPHAGIAVDVTHATDCPTIDKKQEGDIGLGRGPVVYRGPNFNPKVVDRLLTAASANQIPVQHAAVGRPTGTDANPMQLSAGGVATGLVSLPNRYMHSAVEMVSLTDIDHAADLLAAFVVGMDGSEDFTP